MPSGEPINENEMVDSAADNRTANNTMRHQYKILTEAEKAQMVKIKDMGLMFDVFINTLPSKREYSIAKTKMEEAVMWAVKGLTQ